MQISLYYIFIMIQNEVGAYYTHLPLTMPALKGSFGCIHGI